MVSLTPSRVVEGLWILSPSQAAVDVSPPAGPILTDGVPGEASAANQKTRKPAEPRDLAGKSIGKVADLVTAAIRPVETEILARLSSIKIANERVFGELDHVFPRALSLSARRIANVSASEAILAFMGGGVFVAAIAGLLKSRREEAETTYVE